MAITAGFYPVILGSNPSGSINVVLAEMDQRLLEKQARQVRYLRTPQQQIGRLVELGNTLVLKTSLPLEYRVQGFESLTFLKILCP